MPFFNLQGVADTNAKLVNQVLLRMESAQPFAASIAKKYGYPVWSAVVTGKINAGKYTYLLPLKDSGSTEIIHFIELRKNTLGNYDAVLHRKQDYLRYSTSRKPGEAPTAADRFLYKYFLVNDAVFGYTRFKVPDLKFFAFNHRDVSAPIQLQVKNVNKSARMIYREICVTYTVQTCPCTTPAKLMSPGASIAMACPCIVNQTYTACTGWWADDVTVPGENTGGGGSGGTGEPGDCDPYAPPTGPAAIGGTSLYVMAFAPPPACPPPPGEEGPYPVTPMQIFYDGLTDFEKVFWDDPDNIGYVNLFLQNLLPEFSEESIAFVKKYIPYIVANPQCSPEIFERRFLYNGFKTSYVLTTSEEEVISQLDAEEASESSNAPLDCKGTKVLGNIAFNGTKEHWIVQMDYLARNPIFGEREFAIPGSSESSGRGRADFVNKQTGEIFELKPVTPNEVSAGNIEVQRYVDKANQFCPLLPGVNWKRGVNYSIRVLPSGVPNYYIEVDKSIYGGVITYRPFFNNTPPQNLPIIIPADALVKLRNLVDKLKGNFEELDKIIIEYLKSPEGAQLKTYIKSAAVVAAIAVVVATIVEDIGTAGIGLADDPACFYLAGRLVRLAWAL